MVRTSAATRCRIGPATSRNDWRRSSRRWAALEADARVAPGRAKHPTAANGKIGGPLTQRMRKKIDDGGFETPYRLRKQVVEPVFGQIKQARGFRQFLLRKSNKYVPSGR